jgi:hypothetical protein
MTLNEMGNEDVFQADSSFLTQCFIELNQHTLDEAVALG